ncbi:hypothetical protein N3K66_005733 [Trichothecium roseum]|uniref:Uncharacterized protein n=1 Tax=Trichothecium roseum TaxID=47278 RepID=A0ACC0UYP3_9HYPO|nr:hypothetical protein N3K66_005733 [Trichothecium roseum]
MAAPPRRALRQGAGATVPRDQLKHLDQDTSWDQDQPNIPESVKQTLIQAIIHDRNRRSAKGWKEAIDAPSLPRPTKAARRRVSGFSSQDTPADSFPSTPPDREISWSPSPSVEDRRNEEVVFKEEEKRESNQNDGVEGAEEEMKGTDVDGTDVDHNILSQPLSPSMHYEEPETTKSPVLHEFPPTIDEEELEIQLPQFETQPPRELPSSSAPGTPLRCYTQSLSTPTCAQDITTVAPRTVGSSRGQALVSKATFKKPKLINYQDLEGRAPKKPRMETTKTYEDPESSMATTVSDVIPGTVGSREAPGPRSNPGHVSMTCLSEEAPVTSSEHNSTSTDSHAEMAPPASADGRRSEETRPPVVSRVSVNESRDFLPSFDVYSATYPTYTTDHKGNLERFIMACMCLDHLREGCALHHFLWDDFIRAFSSGYIKYSQMTNDGPMGVLEWFSSLNEAPLFTKMVIHQTNLCFILCSYRSTVNALKPSIYEYQTKHPRQLRCLLPCQDSDKDESGLSVASGVLTPQPDSTRHETYEEVLGGPKGQQQQPGHHTPSMQSKEISPSEALKPQSDSTLPRVRGETPLNLGESQQPNSAPSKNGQSGEPEEPVLEPRKSGDDAPRSPEVEKAPLDDEAAQGPTAMIPSVQLEQQHTTQEISPPVVSLVGSPHQSTPTGLAGSRSPELGFDDVCPTSKDPSTRLTSKGVGSGVIPTHPAQPRSRKSPATPSSPASRVVSSSAGPRKLSYMDRIRKASRKPSNPKKEAERKSRIQASVRSMQSGSFTSTRSGTGL